MNKQLINHANQIVKYAINNVLPTKAVQEALKGFPTVKGKTYIIAIGKAAYSMAKAANSTISCHKGLIVTKYHHSKGPIANFEIIEAGHPILDANSLKAGQKALDLVQNLSKDDVVIFLVSGGGSALFESALVDLATLQDINQQLLKSGANIQEINTIRKRLSKVKGGKLALACQPAQVFNIILSDVINDPLDIIASGCTIEDQTTSQDAYNIINKYQLDVSKEVKQLLCQDGVKHLDNVTTKFAGNNTMFKNAAIKKCRQLGYQVIDIAHPLTCDINQAEKEMIALYQANKDKHCAIIASGEITLQIKGNGLGGRNQQLALQLANKLDDNACALCISSDGTDGPTDCDGAYCQKDMLDDRLQDYLNRNDSYHYLESIGGLIKTGPTGSNVCDLYVILNQNKKCK